MFGLNIASKIMTAVLKTVMGKNNKVQEATDKVIERLHNQGPGRPWVPCTTLSEGIQLVDHTFAHSQRLCGDSQKQYPE